MKAFILERLEMNLHVEEGDELVNLGVFSTKAKANAAIKGHSSTEDEELFDYEYNVSTWSVDKE
jgi:hypothetical protein